MSPGVRPLRVVYGVVLAAIAAATTACSYLLRFGGAVPDNHWDGMLPLTACGVAVKLASFYGHRLDRGAGPYVGFYDLVVIARATTWSTIGLTLVDAFALPMVAAPRGVLLIDWCVTLVAMAALQSAPRAARDLRAWWRGRGAAAGRPALIVGANDDGEALLRALRTTSRTPLRVVGFLDADPARHGRRIGGAPVLGAPADLARHAARTGAAEVLVAGSLTGAEVRGVLAEADRVPLPVRVLPTIDQLLEGGSVTRPRPVAIEDLLRREPARLDDRAIAQWLRGRTVLVTGSAGSIGSEVCRQLLRHGPAKVVAVDRSENGQYFLERELSRLAPGRVETVLADVCDRPRIEAVFADHRPAVVFHAAAYKHVPLLERHPGEAVKNIILATRTVADVADRAGVDSFVLVSTDKAVNPTSVMGACKRVAERYVRAMAASTGRRFLAVRFGNVLDSAGSVIPLFREQIARGGPVTVTHPDITRFFMMIPEAAQLVIQAGAIGRGGEAMVLDMGEPIRIFDLATDMIRLSGLRPGEDIEVVVTGLRPGEKLYEELYGDDEARVETSHEKVLVVRGDAPPMVRVLADVNHLAERIDDSPGEVRAELFRLAAFGGASSPAAAEDKAAKRRAA